MTSEISLDIKTFTDIVRGQERLESKLDIFLSTQKVHDTKLDQLDTRVDQVEQSVSDMKAQRRQDVAVVTALWVVFTTVGAAGIWIIDKVNWTAIKALFVKI